MNASSSEKWLTTGDIARRVGVTPSTVLSWILVGVNRPGGRKKLQAQQVGKWYRIKEEWLAAFIGTDEPRKPVVEARRKISSSARHDQVEAARLLKGKGEAL